MASESIKNSTSVGNGLGLSAPLIQDCFVRGSYGAALAGATDVIGSEIFDNASISNDQIRYNNTILADNADSATPETIQGMYIAGNAGGGVRGIPVEGCSIVGNHGPGVDANITVSNSNVVFNEGPGIVGGSVSNSYVHGNLGGDVAGGVTGSTVTNPIQSAPPFLMSIDPDEDRPIGVGRQFFTLTFSKPMQPTRLIVSFGQSAPFSSHIMNASPGWLDNRTWRGWYAIGGEVGDGTHTLRVARAVSQDGFALPPDTYHCFTVDTLDGDLSISNGRATALNASQVMLAWDPAPRTDLDGYTVFQSLSSNGPWNFVKSLSAPATNTTIDNLNQSATYYYMVYEYDTLGNSAQLTSPISTTTLFECRINCGGPQYTDSSRKVWYGDQAYAQGGFGYVGGGTYSTVHSIVNTADPSLYQTERYSPATYRFTVPNGQYEVILHFAEIFFDGITKGGVGSRIFDATIEHDLVLDNIDLFATLGHDTAGSWTFNKPVADGVLDIIFKASVNNSKISAIEIRQLQDAVPMTFSVEVVGTGSDNNKAIVNYTKPDNTPGTVQPGFGNPVTVDVLPGSSYVYSATLTGSDKTCHRWWCNQKWDGTAPQSGSQTISRRYYEQWKPTITLTGADATHLLATESHVRFAQQHLEINVSSTWSDWCDAGSRLTFAKCTAGTPSRCTSAARSWIVNSCLGGTVTYLGPSVPVTFAVFLYAGSGNSSNTATVNYTDPSGIQKTAYPAPGASVSVSASAGSSYRYTGSLAGSNTDCHRWWCNQNWLGTLPTSGPVTIERRYFEQWKPIVTLNGTDKWHTVKPEKHVKFAMRVETSEPYTWSTWSDWCDQGSQLIFPKCITGYPTRCTSLTRAWVISNCNSKSLTYTSGMAELVINLPGLPQGAKRLEMVRIPAGTFEMGSVEDWSWSWNPNTEIPVHTVTFAHDYYISRYEITQAQWRAVMGTAPSYFTGNDLPVEQVTWDMGKIFIQMLNTKGQGTFRLPSEAQWEYACRGPVSNPNRYARFSFGDSNCSPTACTSCLLGDYAWWCGNQGTASHVVGQLIPNAFSLFDMHGNILEWCEDDWHANYNGAPPDGLPWVNTPNRSASRVLRGGHWHNVAHRCRSAYRSYVVPSHYSNDIGLRIVRDAP